MKKHNARKKKIANRIKANNTKASNNQKIGMPVAGYINHDQFEINQKATLSMINDFKSGKRLRFYHNLEERAFHLMALHEEDRTSIAHAIAKSRLLKQGEQPLGTAMYPAFLKHTESPYWNIGSFGSIWMDVKSDSGRDFRVSIISDSAGDMAFAVFPQLDTEEEFMELVENTFLM